MRVIRIGERYSISTDEVETYDLLPVKTYVVLYNEKDGFYLTEHTNIEVREKIYGVYENKVNKVLRAFEVFQRSLGTILSGDKGIGKSIFAKLLCQKALEKGEYSRAAEPPVRCGESHLSGLAEPPVIYSYCI